MQLILLRHPPVLDGQARCYGRLDLAIDPRHITASILAARPYADWPLFSSPARRCRQLAEVLSTHPQIWPELQELDFGSWEGRLWNEIEREELDAWAADIWHYRPGNGESAAMLRSRWQLALARWQALEIEQAIVISHAGLIRMALAETGQIAEAERWNAPIEHAHAYEVNLP